MTNMPKALMEKVVNVQEQINKWEDENSKQE